MKKYILLILLVFFSLSSFSQEKYITRNGEIQFLSDTPIETIHAINNHVSCILDVKNGDIVFQLRIISFEFEKALMEEHFNEKYMESEKYPKSTFVGRIRNWDINYLSKEGPQQIEASGLITIHGIEKEIKVLGSFTSQGELLVFTSNFDIKVADFNIDIPKIVRQNISELITIEVEVKLKQN